MHLRQLFNGVLAVLSFAVADFLNGNRSEAEMDSLSPDWQDVADLYDPDWDA